MLQGFPWGSHDKERECESRSVVSDSLQSHGLHSPWDSPDQNTGVGCHALLQGNFPTQGSISGLPPCRWVLSQLSHQCRRRGLNPWVGKVPWRRERLPPPVFLPGEPHGQRSLVGYSPRGPKDLDTTERLTTFHHRCPMAPRVAQLVWMGG